MEKPNKAYDFTFSDTDNGKGWAFGSPKGISTVQWPRSRMNGTPMLHLWTLSVPEEYRTKGPEYVAISLFQADDHVSDSVERINEVITDKIRVEEEDAQQFWDSLLAYAENIHPMELFMEDIIGGGWVLIWLTKEEFEGEETAIPEQEVAVYPDYDTSDGLNPYDFYSEASFVALEERENDPNVGRDLEDFPDESDEEAYIAMYSDRGKELNLESFFGKTHFGGTANPVQGMPEFTAFYIEFEEAFGNANMGGGNGQIDLLNDEIDWAC